MSDVKAVCLRPGCGRDAKTRGLCAGCYSAARTLVKRGKVTWEQLEEAGKCNAVTPRQAGGGEARAWLLS